MTSPTPEHSEEEVAETLYGSPEALETAYGPALKDTLDLWRDRTGAEPAQVETELREATLTFHEARIPSSDAARIYGAMMHADAQPADEATTQEWATESRRLLRERYGPEEAERRLAAAQEFIRNRPTLAKRLAASGAGSHPEVVLPLAERARDLRMKPRPRTT